MFDLSELLAMALAGDRSSGGTLQRIAVVALLLLVLLPTASS